MCCLMGGLLCLRLLCLLLDNPSGDSGYASDLALPLLFNVLFPSLPFL